ncbi:MAG: type II secretion system protein GspL [Myxococcota bacterium]
MAQTVIGLDIGSWSIKATVLESTLRKFQVVDFVEHHIPRDPEGHPVEEEMSASLAATLRTFGDWDSIITAAPGNHVLTREVELPFTDDKRIRSVLGFQLEDKLPLPIEDLVWDYYRLEEDEEGARLLCPAVQRTWLLQFLSELSTAGADPKVVTLDTLAYGHLVQNLDEFVEEEAVALIDMGHTTTSVSVVEGGRVRTVRTIARGGHHVTMALMQQLGLDYGEAENLKHTAARLDGKVSEGVDPELDARVRAVVDKALQPILRDVRLTLHAHANRWNRAVDHVVLFGGASRMPGIGDVLGAMLGTRVHPARILSQPWAQLPQVSPEAEIAMPKATALALRFMDEGRGSTVNFRQGELALESDFKAIRDRAGWLVLMAVLLIGAFFTKQYLAYQGLQSNHEALVAQLEEFTAQTLGEEHDDFDFVQKKLSRPAAAEAAEVFPDISAFKAFYDITAAQEAVNQMPQGSARAGGGDEEAEEAAGGPPGRRLQGDDTATGADTGEAAGGPTSAYEVELKQIEVDLKDAYVKGEANNIEAVEAFTSRLDERPCFKSVETSDTTRISFGNRQDWLRFQLKVEIGCEEPAEEQVGAGREGT